MLQIRLKTSAYLAAFAAAILMLSIPAQAFLNFDSVREGMEKSDVIEAVGGPTVSRRKQGKDSWLYKARGKHSPKETTEVLFDDGKVVYVGPPIAPKKTAVVQDQQNEQANLEEQKRIEEEQAQRDAEFGIARAQDPAKRPKQDRLDKKFKQSLYGLPPDPADEKNVSAPVFEPVN